MIRGKIPQIQDSKNHRWQSVFVTIVFSVQRLKNISTSETSQTPKRYLRTEALKRTPSLSLSNQSFIPLGDSEYLLGPINQGGTVIDLPLVPRIFSLEGSSPQDQRSLMASLRPYELIFSPHLGKSDKLDH